MPAANLMMIEVRRDEYIWINTDHVQRISDRPGGGCLIVFANGEKVECVNDANKTAIRLREGISPT